MHVQSWHKQCIAMKGNHIEWSSIHFIWSLVVSDRLLNGCITSALSIIVWKMRQCNAMTLDLDDRNRRYNDWRSFGIQNLIWQSKMIGPAIWFFSSLWISIQWNNTEINVFCGMAICWACHLNESANAFCIDETNELF